MNIRATGRRVEIDAGLDKDIARVSAIWEQSIERSGGPYLFGQFTAADAMYAPVASRFRTYDIQLSGAASAYVQNIHDHPSFKAWHSEALKETWIVDADEAG